MERQFSEAELKEMFKAVLDQFTAYDGVLTSIASAAQDIAHEAGGSPRSSAVQTKFQLIVERLEGAKTSILQHESRDRISEKLKDV